jgi:glycosyltransferase involved in cell wall biosynthesis
VDGRVDVSVVVPVFNEVENIQELYRQLTKALSGREYELLFIDDGSTDASYKVLATLHAQDRRMKVVQLAENFGQHAALVAGIERAHGEVIVTMDADLQSDPDDITLLLDKIAEGYDVVSGWRVWRKDGFLTRRFPSYFVNKTVGTVTGIHLHDYNCPLKAFKAEVSQKLMHYGEMHRFLGALIVRLGDSVAEVQVRHYPRWRGRSKYSFLSLLGLYLDFVTAFPTRTFQIVTLAGLLCSAIGLGFGLLYFPLRFIFDIPLGSRTQFLIFLVLFFGVQFAVLGLLGEFIIRIFRLLQNRPLFVVKNYLC